MPSVSLEEPPVQDRSRRAPEPSGYEPFGNMESRNGLQRRVEIPMLLRALRPPVGGRVLEVGCGRGIALPVLAERLRPASLVGVWTSSAVDDAACVAAGAPGDSLVDAAKVRAPAFRER
jgi:SAM-dependent methyltransferase